MRFRINKTISFKVLLFVLGGCVPREDKDDAAEAVAVQWQLVTNFTDEDEVFEAAFALINKSQATLDDKHWALFFNMAPRTILENKIPQPARLVHINGDWYKLVPNPGFSLAPGASLSIGYRGIEGVIKETDRPLGLYFVYYDDAGEEERIVEVTDYTWKPFVRAEQINRGRADEEPIPTPERIYRDNLSLHKMGDSKLNRIVPTPVKVQSGGGELEVSSVMKIRFEAGLENEAQYLAAMLSDCTGTQFSITDEAGGGKEIALTRRAGPASSSSESYKLTISSEGVTIHGSGPAGVFYGIQSLRSLIPLKAYQQREPSFLLPAVEVIDQPRFAFRGLHLDVSRNFQTKETILRTLDLMAYYKLNRFLFYTTEDEGWRLEIKDLPELTTVGAIRHHTSGMDASALHPAYGSGPFPEAEGTYGYGFYSREDFIEILRYAKARHIKVIPELNFPAHARAAIKAMEARYDRLMAEGKETEANEYRLIDPDDKSEYLSAQGYKDNVVCVARESAYHFYEKVVDEIDGMYQEAGLQLDEFHTGGDEVPAGAWTDSPMINALLKEHPEIGGPENLQTYFFRNLIGRLKSRGYQLDGWEEVALRKTEHGENEINPEFSDQHVVPFIWNNMFDYPDLGYRLANAGYQVVLCNVSNFYFDLAYSKDPLEPGLYWAGFVNTRNAWTFAPYDMFKTTDKNSMGKKVDMESGGGGVSGARIVEHLRPTSRDNILGVEAQVWSETIKGRDMLEYYMLPKLMGFAESAWAPERTWETVEARATRNDMIMTGWNHFANVLARKELPKLAYLNGGYNYRLPPPGAVIEDGVLKANVEYPGLTIRYTVDGTEPVESSPEYVGFVNVNAVVRLKSFDAAGRSSRTVMTGPR